MANSSRCLLFAAPPFLGCREHFPSFCYFFVIGSIFLLGLFFLWVAVSPRACRTPVRFLFFASASFLVLCAPAWCFPFSVMCSFFSFGFLFVVVRLPRFFLVSFCRLFFFGCPSCGSGSVSPTYLWFHFLKLRSPMTILVFLYSFMLFLLLPAPAFCGWPIFLLCLGISTNRC